MIDLIAQLVFWASSGVLAYVYAGYPLLVYLIARTRAEPLRDPAAKPTVTVLITAYNEEAAIREKIENTFGLEHPLDKLEILVASDGSTDTTDDIVRSFSDRGVRLLRVEGRKGKTFVQNAAVEAATGEIILFSDATTHYDPSVLNKVLPFFADVSVGCVAGRLIYRNDEETVVGDGATSYWGYETYIKGSESKACSLIGASGCLYAVRRSAYVPMYPEACSDFLICTVLYRKGLRTVFAPDAVCYEHVNRDSSAELRMRIRVIAQTFADLWRNRDMMNPFKSGFYAIQLISHKLLRYAVPILLAAMFIANAVLISSGSFYSTLFALQAIFYILAVVGWITETAGLRSRILSIPQYFVLANIASVIAFYKFLRGERFASWEPIRPER
ncbi:MAG: glycosyltransferase family 2 protein [Acidobacteria bacterium]|nr:glycosyltransferase family 2 protein [Acidobacteriota bacterium]